jgi:hypothetical protein
MIHPVDTILALALLSVLVFFRLQPTAGPDQSNGLSGGGGEHRAVFHGP